MRVLYLRSKHYSIKIMLTTLFTLLVMFSPLDLSGLLFTYCESTSTELVVWGDILPSNVGGLRFSPLISSMVKFPIHVKGMIIGLILSDA